MEKVAGDGKSQDRPLLSFSAGQQTRYATHDGAPPSIRREVVGASGRPRHRHLLLPIRPHVAARAGAGDRPAACAGGSGAVVAGLARSRCTWSSAITVSFEQPTTGPPQPPAFSRTQQVPLPRTLPPINLGVRPPAPVTASADRRIPTRCRRSQPPAAPLPPERKRKPSDQTRARLYSPVEARVRHRPRRREVPGAQRNWRSSGTRAATAGGATASRALRHRTTRLATNATPPRHFASAGLPARGDLGRRRSATNSSASSAEQPSQQR